MQNEHHRITNIILKTQQNSLLFLKKSSAQMCDAEVQVG
jgi:hypothetical protein